MEFRTFSPVRYNAPVKTHESDRKNTVSFGGSTSEDKPVHSKFKKFSIPLLLASLTGGAFMGIGPGVSDVGSAKPSQVQQAVSQTALPESDAKWVRSQLASRPKDEVQNILDWMNRYDLNRYGDPKGTRYAGGTPLFNEGTGETLSLYKYLETKPLGKVWNREAFVIERLQDVSAESRLNVLRWMQRHRRNQYGDPLGTGYLGGTPLFDEGGGGYMPLSVYLQNKDLLRPEQVETAIERESWVYDHLQDKPHKEREQVIRWMGRNLLNQYGDRPNLTFYPLYGPLFNTETGKFQKLSEYLAEHHPQKPWLNEN